MKEPLLSIIVPVYNAGEFLRPCIQSILSNKYENFELLLICDEPTDDSLEIGWEYSKTDARVKAINIPHGGVSVARNTGLFLASGEWIGFVDADDTIAPNRFSDAINAANEYGVEMVSCAIQKVINGNFSHIIKSGVGPGLVSFKDGASIFGLCTNFIYKASLIKDNKITFQDCDYGEDSLFSIQAFFYAGKVYNLGTPLYYLTRGHESLSTAEMTEERKQRLLDAASKVINQVSEQTNDSTLFLETIIKYLGSRPIFKKQ